MIETARSSSLSILSEAIPDPVVIWSCLRDGDGSIVDLRYEYVNAAAEETIGVPRDELVGRLLLEVLPRHRELGLFDRYCAVATSGIPDVIDIPWFDDGNVAGAFQVSVAPFGNGVVSIARNVTAAVQAQRELVASEAQQRNLMAAIPDAVLVINGTVIDFANRASVSLLGARDADDLVGRDTSEFLSVLQSRAAIQYCQKFIAEGRADAPFVSWLRRLDGSPLLVEATPALVPGSETGLLLVMRDITERQRLQEELAASEAMSRFLADHATEMLVRADSLQRVVYASPFTGSMLELAPDDLLGVPLSALFVEEDRASVAAAVAEAVADGVASPREVRAHTAASDHTVWVEVTIRAVIGARTDSRAVEYHLTLTDVEERRATRLALANSERRMRTFVESAPIGIFEMSPDGTQQYVNPHLLAIAGIDSAEAAMGTVWHEMVHPDDIHQLVDAWISGAQGGDSFHEEFRLVTASGQTRWVETEVVPVLDADRRIQSYLGTVEDVTDRRVLEASRVQAMEIFRGVFAGAPNAMVLTSVAEFPPRIVMANDAFVEMTHRSVDDLADLDVYAITDPAHADQARAAREALMLGYVEHDLMEMRQLDGLGRWRWYTVSRSVLRGANGSPEFMVSHIVDITERKLADETVFRLVLTDPLTGLSNRRHFLQALGDAPSRHEDGHRRFAVIFLDLDRFKTVNDELGHHAGDRLLEDVAATMQAVTRPGDLIARLGGDEFAVIVEQVNAADVCEIAERLCAAMSFPRELPRGGSIVVTASIGCALAESGAVDAEALLRRADAAMYRAKQLGRNRWAIDTDE